MFSIRRGVFETNSSSTHSVCITNQEGMYPYSSLQIDDDNYIHVTFGAFGWEIEDYYTPYERLQYLVTMLVETEGSDLTSVDQLMETEGFGNINFCLSLLCGCYGIKIDSRIRVKSWTCSNGETKQWLERDGYIDHQSCEYKNIQEFLDSYGLTIEGFIFNKNVYVHTDNDND